MEPFTLKPARRKAVLRYHWEKLVVNSKENRRTFFQVTIPKSVTGTLVKSVLIVFMLGRIFFSRNVITIKVL